MQTVADVVAIACLLTGTLFALVAGIGLMRFPDVVSRLHAGTKPQVAGVLLILTAAVIRMAGTPAVWMLLLGGLLQLLTVPLSAHMIGQIAYRRQHLRRELLLVDEAVPPPPAGPDEPRGDEPADAPVLDGRPGVDPRQSG